MNNKSDGVLLFMIGISIGWAAAAVQMIAVLLLFTAK